MTAATTRRVAVVAVRAAARAATITAVRATASAGVIAVGGFLLMQLPAAAGVMIEAVIKSSRGQGCLDLAVQCPASDEQARP